MINKLITFSIHNKLIIGLFTLVIIGLGIWSMLKVPVDAVPDITNNQVQVITQAPNLGTEDIEQFVTYPVELAMANLPGVIEVRSVSRFGLSVVTIVFDNEMDTYLPRQLVSEKLTEVKESIPENIGKPGLGPISTGLGEIYQYSIEVDSAYQDQYSLMDLRTIQDWIIRRQMAMVPGVVEVNAFGGEVKQYEVAVSPDKLKSMNISMAEIMSALQANNQNTGGAYIEKNHQANFIRGEGIARSISDIESIVVKQSQGIPLTIKDIGEVRFGAAIRYGAFTKNGQGEAVGGMILMLKGENSAEVISAVKARMEQIEKSLPEGVHIEPFLDRSNLVEKTTSTIKSNLLEGGLIVILVLVILLGNWRGGLIVASTIPLSLLFAFILMNIFDVWANLMSLGAIDFGIIVDGAVIIVESTVFYLHQHLKKGKLISAKSRNKIALSSSKRMMNSAFFGQLIILIVFLPVLALEGVEGKMFKPMALTFIFAMLGAMILCLTYVPMMSALFLRVKESTKASWSDKILAKTEKFYLPLLTWSLQKGKLILLFMLGLVIATVFLFRDMGAEFIPQLDEGDIAFHIVLAPGSSLTESVAVSTKIEKILLENFPEVDQVLSRFGVADVPTDPMPMDIGDSFIILKPKSEWVSASTKEELIEKIKAKISQVPGVNFEFTQPIEMRFNELLTGVREDIAIKLFGEDLEILADKANEIASIIGDTPGIGDLKVEATTGLPQMTVKYDREKIAQYGLNIEKLNTTIATAFAGQSAGLIFEGEKRFDLVLRLDSADRSGIDDVENLFIDLPSGQQVPMGQVAKISYQPGPMQISRDNTNRRTYVGINVRGRDVQTLMEEIKSKLDENLSLPPGYYIRYGGAFENLERASSRLQIVVPVALLSIFVLIYFALGSLPQTLMIYIAIPLAAVGGVFSLWLRGMPFSISAGVGFIVLFGVAVLNGLVLINGLNELKENENLGLRERIILATKRRLRPIMLTALTDILGFLPMALSSSAGAEVQRPLATVVIGGLLTSTILTLFILPILYQWMESRPSNGRSMNTLTKAMGIITFFALTIPFAAEAQDTNAISISQEKAIQKAQRNYPELQRARLEIEKEKFMKKSAWDFGNTQVFTGGEELKDGNGIYTIIGLQQQQMDIFGIPAKTKYHEARIGLAEAALNLSMAELTQEVRKAYAEVYIQKRKLDLFQKIDSTYARVERAAEVRFKSQASSKLEWLAVANRHRRSSIDLQKSQQDLLMAEGRFNLWMFSDTLYTVESLTVDDWIASNPETNLSQEPHPLVLIRESQLEASKTAVKSATASYLPKISGQYGIQEVGGQTGYSTFQLGISLPLFFNQSQAQVQRAKVESKQAYSDLIWMEEKLSLEKSNAFLDYKKWQNTYQYFQTEAFPLAEQQLRGARLAYEAGQIDYLELMQNVNDALQLELEGLEALEYLLTARIKLDYLNQNYSK
ncbi:acriflavine resistance protein B [Echinicola pacifica]|uniref:Acriflavine resistance protein B n=1 Tax=Echinicola pacifica TaxID=346377 RepID=A0A918UKJ0_9BACT|nr:CusA/CzcA family heavy metal efflux RND transporter [Echinicola pacifica]GGZ16497.1 acriflavine resistance protein B [Echinicola pacifica]